VVESNPELKKYSFQRHKPEETVLYKVIQNNWLSFQAQEEEDTGHPLPDFVIREFEEYFRCGILAHGFLRAQCESCQRIGKITPLKRAYSKYSIRHL